MSTTAPSESLLYASPWPRRLAVAFLICAATAGLHYFVGQGLLPRGMHRPILLSSSLSVFLAFPIVAVILTALAYLAERLSRDALGTQGLASAGLALAIWAALGGTMTDWLTTVNVDVGAASGWPYARLMPEYALLLACVAAAALASAIAAATGGASDAQARTRGLEAAFALRSTRAEWRSGLLAMVITAAVAGVLLLVLNGPREGATRRGQVYFAVGVAFTVGVMIAYRVTGARHAMWYWLAPFAVGLVGAGVASLWPALPGPYQQLNNIPVLGLVRALPIELIAVGLPAVLWTLSGAEAHRRHTEAHG